MYDSAEAYKDTGLLHARARMYSPGLGRFVSRDMHRQGLPLGGYHDGPSLYSAYFAPNGLDPTGMYECCKPGQTGPVRGGYCCNGTMINAKDQTTGCCGSGSDARTYNKNTQCCSSGTVSEKTRYWVCKRPLSGMEWQLGPISHSYVVCSDPNGNPPPTGFGLVPSGSMWGSPGVIHHEPAGTRHSNCKEKSSCDNPCKNGIPPDGSDSGGWYSWYWSNCHNWANQ